MKGLKDLTANQRRKIFFYILFGLFAIACWALSRPGVLTNNAPPVNTKNLFGNADDHALGVASIDKQVADQKSEMGQVIQRLDRLERQGSSPTTSQQSGVGSFTQTNLGQGAGQSQPIQGSPAFGAPNGNGSPNPQPTPPIPNVGANGGINAPNGSPPNGYQSNGMPEQSPSVVGPPQIQTWGEDPPAGKKGTGTTLAPAPATPAPTDASEPSANEAKAAQKVFIPAGTMLTGVLLTGADAPTGREASSHPIPVLIRVKEDAILPNEYRADYRECFIVSSAMGDLSSERAYMRIETLSCVARNGGVIQAALQGWGTGEDGKAGMRGTLVSKQGSALAKAFLAGFASGISNIFKPQTATVVATNGNPYATLPIGEAGRQAGMSGVSSASDQLANYYIQLADSEFPVIEISAGRPVTFIVEKGADLSKLEDKK